MEIREVKNKLDEKAFLKVAHSIYKEDPNWVCPLDNDIIAVFDPQQNSYFKTGECRRWLLIDDHENTIGRIAAFHHEKHLNQDNEKTGGIGFFECINNKEAAFKLFNTAKEWLITKPLSGMDGPINFGEKDRFWGLMVQGFRNPSYLENYNPPYYQDFFESYGFKKIVEQSTSEISVAEFRNNKDRFERIASRVLNNPDYRFEHYRDNQLDRFADDFISIYNQAWASRPDFTPMTKERVRTTLKALRPILLEELIWFAYAHGEPAGFYVNTIDVNQIFRHLKGKMDLLAKIKFLWYKTLGRIDRGRGIVFGVIPKYQNLGLEAGMIMNFYRFVHKYPNLKSAELAWIGDFNPKMHSLFNALGAKITKVHYTYNYRFA